MTYIGGMNQKECPSCAMMIEQDAKECPICAYEYPQSNRLYPVVAIILVLIFILAYIF